MVGCQQDAAPIVPKTCRDLDKFLHKLLRDNKNWLILITFKRFSPNKTAI